MAFEFGSHQSHVVTRASSAAVDPARVKELSQLSLLSKYNLTTAEFC